MKISYEFYPPGDLDYKKVVNEFALISEYKPRFISITYGAMGSSQEKSSGLIKEFKRETNVEVVAHLTLVGKSKSDLKRIIDEFKSLGVQKIVALRGDSPEGKFQAHPDGFYNTSDFVKFLCEKLSKMCGFFAKLRHCCNKDLLRVIYFALVESHLQYCNIIWGNASEKTLAPLVKLQDKIIRIMCFSQPDGDQIENLYNDLKILDIKQLNKLSKDISLIPHSGRVLFFLINFLDKFP